MPTIQVNGESYFTIKDVAERANRESHTIRRWIREQRVPYQKRKYKGRYIFTEEEVRRFESKGNEVVVDES